ncbi:phage tail tape measure protein [Paenibacillus sp. P96]|uniref:Phage tail tape measure protein n=1 Tax=Paenibacillus zeirhizosphaerae TaxID=2987519 RepID=A0ABT9FL69_9BACL|nr:phage tail tape measure protein [Paenibacillus sp. P96]MDP4095476.1 phage tail tape measure protein [Paenibacillus sp. P96]
MANENDIGGRVSLDTTEFKASIAALNRQIQVIDTGFRAAAAGMDDWGKSEEGLQQRINALNQITDLQQQKVANLTEQYQRIAAEQGENSRAAQTLQVQINRETEALNRNLRELNSVTGALDDLQNASDDTTDSTDELADSTNEAADQLKEMGGNVAMAAAAGIAAIGAAALAAIASLVKFGDESNKAMNHLQTQTGATAEEMEEFRDIAESIYANNFGDGVDDIANSMAVINQVTKLTGDELKRTTENALLMRDVFGFEVADSIKTVNNLMNNFGISADEAYTLIAQGTQMGANASGDLLDVMNEFAPHFAQLGLDANEFTDTLIQGASSGAFEMATVGDAVKEFGIITRDGTDEARAALTSMGLDASKVFETLAAGGPGAAAAFDDVVERLGAIEDPIARNTAGVALFGTMWEDLGPEAIKALGDIDDNADMTRDTLQQLNSVQYNDIGSALEGLKRQIVSGLAEPVQTTIIPAITNLIQTVQGMDFSPIITGLGWIINNAGSIVAAAASITAGMLAWNVVSMVTGLVSAFKLWREATVGLSIAQAALNVVMAANPIGLVVTVVAALVAGIITLWNTNDGFRNALISAWEAIKNAFIAVFDWVKNNWQGLLLMLTSPVTGSLKLLYDNNPKFKEWVDKLWSIIVDTLKNLPATVGKFFTDLFGNMKKWGTDSVSWVTTEVPKIVTGIINFFNELPGKLGYAFGQALGTFVKWHVDAAKWIITEVPKLITSIVTFFQELPGKLKTILTTAINNIIAWGSSIASWISSTVPQLISNITNFFAQLPGKIAAELSSALEKVKGWTFNLLSTAKTEIPKFITSVIEFFKDLPKKMLEIGKDIVRGLWDGMSNMAGWLKSKVSDFATGIVDGMKDALDIHSPSRVMRDEVGKMIGLGMAEGITDSTRQVSAAMQQINGEVTGGTLTSGDGQAGGGAKTENTFSFEGMMSGATFVVRQDADIQAIVKEVSKAIKVNADTAARGVGAARGYV